MRVVLRVVAAGACLAGVAGGQAQQAGTTWQRSDSVYKLAVDTSYKTDRPTLYLLDEGVIRFEADGRGSRTFHQVIQVLKQTAVEGMSERVFSWMPDRQTMQVNWIKVLKPTGEVVSEGPAQSQDSDVPAALANPVYGNQRVRRVSLSGLAPGMILDYSYTTVDTAAYPPRDQYDDWFVTTAGEVRRSRLLVDVPQSINLSVIERNINFKRTERVVNGRRLYEWATTDVPYTRSELFASDSNSVKQVVIFALPQPWKDIGTWYAGLAKDRYVLGEAARAKVKAAVANARTRDDSIRAAHKLVAHDIRYVSVSLGIGGYQPRRPDTVAVTGFGDCKDKATFFVAILRDWGMRAHPVLLSAGGPTETSLPSARQFDHAIAAVELPGGGYQFTDLTASTVPYGDVPGILRGQFVIVVRADGRVDETRIPAEPIASRLATTRIAGELTPDGIFNGRYSQTMAGSQGQVLRAAFDTPLDSTQKANLLRSLAGSVYTGATGDSLTMFDVKDPKAIPSIGLTVRAGKAGMKSGSTMILNLNLGSYASLSSAIDRLTAAGPRKFTIDASLVLGESVRDTEFRVTLPEGWKAQLPQGMNLNGDFGQFRTEYTQVGRELIIRRQLTGSDKILGPERVADLIAFLKSLSQDDVKFILITTT